jgi:hypothetical protein
MSPRPRRSSENEANNITYTHTQTFPRPRRSSGNDPFCLEYNPNHIPYIHSYADVAKAKEKLGK